jgi:hypothetical protein
LIACGTECYTELVTESRDTHLLCHRCGAVLTPGAGDFYVVRIEAFADPSPPRIDLYDDSLDPAEEIDRLIEQMHNMSEQELMDQVYRRLTIHLCGACYRRWIENPSGDAPLPEGKP